MRIKLLKFSVITFSYLAVLLPLFLRYRNIVWTDDFTSVLYNLFPGFGLVAFSLLWLHSLSGVFEPWLRKHFNFDQFVHRTAFIILISFILHPLLLLIILRFNFSELFYYGQSEYIWLGIIGWLLLITYDIGKALKKHHFFARNWNKILVISTIGFLLTFFHSIGLGSDLQTGALRTIWLFYGITAIISTIYTYGIKLLFLHKE